MTPEDTKRLAAVCAADEEFQKEWAEINRNAKAGDEEAATIVELNRRAAMGDEFSADLLYLGELMKVGRERKEPPARMQAMLVSAMKQIMAKHRKRRTN